MYKQVCAACHSMKFIYYRHFVDTIMTEEEAKAEAAEATIHAFGDRGQPIDVCFTPLCREFCVEWRIFYFALIFGFSEARNPD